MAFSLPRLGRTSAVRLIAAPMVLALIVVEAAGDGPAFPKSPARVATTAGILNQITIRSTNPISHLARHPRHATAPKPCIPLDQGKLPEIVPVSASSRLSAAARLPAPPRPIPAPAVEMLPAPDDEPKRFVAPPVKPRQIVQQGGQSVSDPTPAVVPELPLEVPSPEVVHDAAESTDAFDSPPPPIWQGNPNFIPWEIFAQGEYIGPPRIPRLPEYRVRVDDALLFVYRLTRDTIDAPYRLKVGDVLKVESITSEPLNQTITVEPDGMITLPIAGRLMAAGRTLDELTKDIESRISSVVRDPAISILPEQLDQRLEELRATVDNRSASGGQSFEATVTPDGTIQLPAVGNVSVVGLSLPELNTEIAARYAALFPGIDVTAVLRQRAERYVYVLGEVRTAGRFALVAPTTALQALSLAGGHLVGADLTNLVVLRRDENWRLVACRLDLSEDIRGDCINRTHDVWLRDSDILLVPKSHCQRMDEYIDLVLTRGLYGIVPLRYAVSYTRIAN